jgi:hypothetical protein
LATREEILFFYGDPIEMMFMPAKASVVASEISGDWCRLLLPPLPGCKQLLPLILHSRAEPSEETLGRALSVSQTAMDGIDMLLI